MRPEGYGSAPGRASRFAVIDTETTGFSRYDRIVEFACVTVMDGAIVEEYETLIQPQRDPGPTHIHGITPSMLDAAPEFSSVAGDIAARLDGALLVAHNISFDLRMLRQEVGRLARMTFDPGEGICTYRLTKLKLSLAAEKAGIPLESHTALGDARAAAQLLLAPSTRWEDSDVATATCHTDGSSSGFTVRRPGAPPRRGALSMLALRTAWPRTTTEAEVLYLDTLDRCLDDGVLSRDEQAWLTSTAHALQLSKRHLQDLHERYYTRLVEQILADGVVTRLEKDLHDKVASALMIDHHDLPPVRPDRSAKPLELVAGQTVCFTGIAVVDGEKIPRQELEHLARRAGLRPVKSVTRRCNLVVAGDPRSRSGKARKARDLGIPVIDAARFKALAT